MKNECIGIRIYRRKEKYTENPQKISYQRMMDLIELLEAMGYVKTHIRGVNEWKHNKPTAFETSITEFTDKFIALFSSAGKPFNFSLIQLNKTKVNFEIRKRRTKDVIPTRGKSTKELTEGVSKLNDKLGKTEMSIQFDDRPRIKAPKQQYKRIFTDDMKHGGRFYNIDGSIQTVPSRFRKTILIEGQETTELDFKCMHLSLAYEQIQADLPSDFDPYCVSLPSEWIDQAAIDQHIKDFSLIKYNPVRNLVKMAVMIGLNARDLRAAKLAVQGKIYEDEANEDAKYVGIKSIDMTELFKLITNHNYLVIDRFFNDSGISLQFLESEILDSVLLKILALDEAALPYHDSVLVKKSIAPQVLTFMREAWLEVMGSNEFCHIEEK
jgi:hypothetical protein